MTPSADNSQDEDDALDGDDEPIDIDKYITPEYLASLKEAEAIGERAVAKVRKLHEEDKAE